MPKLSKKAQREKGKTAQATALAPYKFKPGQSGNPNGRPKIPEDVKKTRKFNQIELERIANKYLYMSVKQLNTRKARNDLPVLDKIVVSMLLKAIEEGEYTRLEWISKRMIGRVGDFQRAPQPLPPNQTQVNIQNQIPGTVDINSLTVEQLEELSLKLKSTAPKELPPVKIVIEKSASDHEPLSWLSDDLEI